MVLALQNVNLTIENDNSQEHNSFSFDCTTSKEEGSYQNEYFFNLKINYIPLLNLVSWSQSFHLYPVCSAVSNSGDCLVDSLFRSSLVAARNSKIQMYFLLKSIGFIQITLFASPCGFLTFVSPSRQPTLQRVQFENCFFLGLPRLLDSTGARVSLSSNDLAVPPAS